jgi:glycosyltransferase involved in cell wall biosynthesis
MVQKPEVIAFAQYTSGGVQNFYYNILSHLPKDQFDVLWILDDFADTGNNVAEIKLFGVCEEIVFKSYHPDDKTVYDRFRRLDKHISDRPGVILTNFQLELATLHVRRKKNKTICFVCHDELYLELAKQYEFLIDVFITHNPQFYAVLKQRFPDRNTDIFYLPYGVNIPPYQRSKLPGKILRIVFAARLVKEKGIFDLHEIMERAEKSCKNVQWTIIGNGPYRDDLKEWFAEKENVFFCNPDSNEKVREIMAAHDLFILPSYLDGLPVAMVEAMSVGCVPVMYRFNEGISDILSVNEGFLVSPGDKVSFAACIIELYNNNKLLEKMSLACRSKIEDEYDIKKCVTKYIDLFLRFKEFKKPVRSKFIAYGGLLESPLVPAFIRAGLRKIIKTFK